MRWAHIQTLWEYRFITPPFRPSRWMFYPSNKHAEFGGFAKVTAGCTWELNLKPSLTAFKSLSPGGPRPPLLERGSGEGGQRGLSASFYAAWVGPAHPRSPLTTQMKKHFRANRGDTCEARPACSLFRGGSRILGEGCGREGEGGGGCWTPPGREAPRPGLPRLWADGSHL